MCLLFSFLFVRIGFFSYVYWGYLVECYSHPRLSHDRYLFYAAFGLFFIGLNCFWYSKMITSVTSRFKEAIAVEGTPEKKNK